jgi:hypothetical protein
MSRIEDILYKAHYEGIKDEVFIESKRLRESDPAKWKHREYSDVVSAAYDIVIKRNKLK